MHDMYSNELSPSIQPVFPGKACSCARRDTNEDEVEHAIKIEPEAEAEAEAEAKAKAEAEAATPVALVVQAPCVHIDEERSLQHKKEILEKREEGNRDDQSFGTDHR